ncbi:B12-binding domain-containing radical SAM protein [Chloroflexota bacterium]
MKLELIQPAREANTGRLKKSMVPPINLGVIAALTPPGIEVAITDENVTIVDLEKDVDLIGITTLTVTSNRAYEIADSFRSRGIPVILGGIHTSLLPAEAAAHADSVVIGEAEDLWAYIIADFKAGNLKPTYKAETRPTLKNLPMVRRDLFDRSRYLGKNTVFTTRGCPFDCAFCSVTTFFGKSYRSRPIDEIVAEIKTLPKNEIIFFMDDNIAGNPKFAKDLFRALIPLKIRWLSQCSVTIAHDEELLSLAAQSGCIDLFLGIESISTASLAEVGKKINKVEEYEEVIRKIHTHGIAIHGFFIFGFDEDDESVFDRTVDFAINNKLESAQFDLLTPYPGTKFYDKIVAEGRLLSSDWSKYGYELLFEPKKMSAQTLHEKQQQVWRRFYSLPSIFKRIGMWRKHIVKLWFLNLYYRNHWKKKNKLNHK